MIRDLLGRIQFGQTSLDRSRTVASHLSVSTAPIVLQKSLTVVELAVFKEIEELNDIRMTPVQD
jgi:hypothetical protein